MMNEKHPEVPRRLATLPEATAGEFRFLVEQGLYSGWVLCWAIKKIPTSRLLHWKRLSDAGLIDIRDNRTADVPMYEITFKEIA